MGLLGKLTPNFIKRRIKKSMGINKSFSLDKIADEIADRKIASKISDQKLETLDGKSALITGASGFIGEEIAIRLAKRGAVVFVCSRKLEKATEISDKIVEMGLKAYPVSLDVTNEESIIAAIDYVVSKFERIDILVNCAGGSPRDEWKYIYEQSTNVIDDMIYLNLRGTMLCTKYASRYMVEQRRGKIINIASTVGVGGKSGFSDYAASKAGVMGFTKSVAIELGKYGITVNCVTPGIVHRGEYNEVQMSNDSNKNVMNSVGIANDIAYGVEFFASDEANFITGQNIVIDGGRSLGLRGDN